MRLADLRKLSIRGQFKIRFRLRQGLECVIGEDGVARVPALRGVPGFNLEDELAEAVEFALEPAGGDRRNPAKPRRASREELAAMLSGDLPGAAEEE